MDFGNIINNLLNQMAFFHLGAGNYVMIVVALVFLYLAIRKGFEPLLLIPIAFGMLLVNIYPDIMYSPEQTSNGTGGLLWYFFQLDEWSILPSLIFLGVGVLLLALAVLFYRLWPPYRKPNQLPYGSCRTAGYLLCLFLRHPVRVLRQGISSHLHHRRCGRPYIPVPVQ